MFVIKNDFSGANIKVLSVLEDKAIIEVDLRDTVDDWFFWCFKVINAAGKTVTFEFPSDTRVGYYGAAVSYDMRHWHWQYDKPEYNGRSFTYTFADDENEVYFAHDMVYRPERFFEFAAKHDLKVNTLCKSEKGRAVPVVEIGDGQEAIMLTARHHACESTGNYVLEGVLEEAIATLSDRFKIICVPFVDYDGVVDGDQGKNRSAHDHNRDYSPDEPARYNTVAKIRRLADKLNIRFAFDFHSPWHLGAINDKVFIPIAKYEMLKNITRFSNVFEAENNSQSFYHYAQDDIHPDIEWNQSNSHTYAAYMHKSGAELAFTLETPYFMAENDMFTPNRAINTGRNFIRAFNKYLKRDFRIAVTGDEIG